MDDQQLLRYSRHILLEELGIEGQEKLLASHALVIGAGGLGSPVALYLGSAGVGRITVIDDDEVDATNLQRQIAHNLERLGTPKAESVRHAIAAINPDPQVTAVVQRADDALLDQLLPGVDVVIDCCDNFATRHMVNRACVRHGVPLNNNIRNLYRNVVNLRTGAEFRKDIFRIRLGYALQPDPYRFEDNINRAIQTISGGVGIRQEKFFIDLAFVQASTEGRRIPYTVPGMASPEAVIKISNTNIVATVGFPF